jgi:hypothetical protein
MNPAPSRRPSAAFLLLAAGLLLPAVPAQATTAPALPAQATTASGVPEVTGQACTGDDGVTVVVDLTDLGEDVRVGCAEGDPATGREALERAGFTTTDSTPGMICAVDGLPDPCPEEFDGNYWAYFTAEPGGGWTARTEGADTADPAPGSFEGWRYNDGSAGPGVETAALADAATESAEVATGETASAEEASAAGENQDDGAEQQAGPSTGTVVAVGAAIVAVVAAVVLLRRRAGGQA